MSGNKISAKLKHTLGPALIIAGVVSSALAAAQTAASSIVALTPAEMKWSSQGALATPGMEQLNLVGDPNLPGPYTLRLKYPKGLKIAPHTHPDSRQVTISVHGDPALSGDFVPTFVQSALKVRLLKYD